MAVDPPRTSPSASRSAARLMACADGRGPPREGSQTWVGAGRAPEREGEEVGRSLGKKGWASLGTMKKVLEGETKPLKRDCLENSNQPCNTLPFLVQLWN